MMRVFYGMRSGHAHRYQCRGDDAHVGSGLCVGIGGIRVDRAVVGRVLEAVAEPRRGRGDARGRPGRAGGRGRSAAVGRELEEARYEASLAERRYEHVDPAKRHVARELEARWNAALERVAALERRLGRLDAGSRRGRGSIARPCCAWPTTCRGSGMRRGRTLAPSSGSAPC